MELHLHSLTRFMSWRSMTYNVSVLILTTNNDSHLYDDKQQTMGSYVVPILKHT